MRLEIKWMNMDVKNAFLNGQAPSNISTHSLFLNIKEKRYAISTNILDDIIFGSTNLLCEEFSKCMPNEFERSMMGA